MGSSEKVAILFVDDVAEDTELAQHELRRANIDCVSQRVETAAAMLEALDTMKPDIVISDYSMPLFDGMEALRLVRERDPLLPFIVFTGTMNEEVAVGCMKAGANDYVIKERMRRLPFVVQEALARRETQRETQEMHRRLAESEQRYRSIFADSDVVMVIIDPSDETIVDANRAAIEFYGWPKEEFIGKGMAMFSTLDLSEIEERRHKAVFLKKRHFQFKNRRADGALTEVEANVSPVAIGGKTYTLLVIQDVSERLAAENERDSLMTRLGHYLTTSPIITYSFRIEGGRAVWQWISENVARILGYSSAEALEPEWWYDHIHPEDRRMVILGLKDLVSLESLAREYRFLTKDRQTVWLRDELRLNRRDDGDVEVVGTLVDISSRKSAEGELLIKSAALDAAANAVVITDREGYIRWANPAFEGLSGYSQKETIGKDLRELVRSGSQDKAFYRSMWGTILEGRVWNGMLVNRTKSGSVYTEEMTITPILDQSRAPTGFVAIKRDVTEREAARNELEDALRQKWLLLQELNNRVNNTLQVISSILSISSPDGDGETNGILGQVGRRIQTLALVHRQFYGSEDVSSIEFSRSLRDIVDEIRGERLESPSGTVIEYETEEAYLDVASAIPAGLIYSEFIANAFLHTLRDEPRHPVIHVSQRTDHAGILEIEVRDDGSGPATDLDDGAPDCVGRILIEGLAEQIGGVFSSSNDGGHRAVIRFPLKSRGRTSAPGLSPRRS